METIKNTERIEKKIFINFFLNNYGEINKSKLFMSILFTFIITSSIILYILIIVNQLINNKSIDYFIITTIYENQIYEFFKYFVINSLGTLNNINRINDLLPLLNNYFTNLPSQIININIPSYNLNMNIGQILTIIISLPITILFYILSIIQSKYQLQLRYSSLVNYYIPLWSLLVYKKRDKNKYVYVKLLNKLRDMNINKDIKEKLMMKVFKVFDNENYELRFIELDFLGFYHFTKLELVKKESKEKDKIDEDKKEDLEIKEEQKTKHKTKKIRPSRRKQIEN